MSLRSREDVLQVWDGQAVVIRQMAVGSTIVYPQMPRGLTYHPMSLLREQCVLARVRDVDEGVRWAVHHYHPYAVMGRPEIRGPR